MHAIAPLLMSLGMLIALVGSLWLLITAFSESLLWGLLCLFTGIGSLVFIVLHWDRAKRPFGWALLGGILAAVAAVIAGGGRAAMPF